MSKYTPAAGIYIIQNTKNGKFYLGQTKHLKRRFKNHKSMLRAGKHSNRHLQAAWNKYGADAFQFLVLEYCETERLNEREQCHLDIYVGKDNCYNIGIDATAPNHGHSEETRAKMSKARKGEGNSFFGKKHDPESREKMKRAARNRQPISDETRHKLSKLNTGRHQTPESIAKIKAKQKGVPKIEETRRKMSEAAHKRPPVSDETRRKLSELHKGKPKSPEHIAKVVEANRRTRLKRALESGSLTEDDAI